MEREGFPDQQHPQSIVMDRAEGQQWNDEAAPKIAGFLFDGKQPAQILFQFRGGAGEYIVVPVVIVPHNRS